MSETSTLGETRQVMVPQHTLEMDIKALPVFGSQLVDKNSATPYSDATQVSVVLEIPELTFDPLNL